jgi:hypothetical protein
MLNEIITETRINKAHTKHLSKKKLTEEDKTKKKQHPTKSPIGGLDGLNLGNTVGFNPLAGFALTTCKTDDLDDASFHNRAHTYTVCAGQRAHRRETSISISEAL